MSGLIWGCNRGCKLALVNTGGMIERSYRFFDSANPDFPMKLLRNLLYIALVVAMAGVGALFALQNEMPVPLDLLVVKFEPRSLALWLLIALALGGVLGMLMSSALVLRTRTALGSANRQLARSKAELDKLRTAGLKDGE